MSAHPSGNDNLFLFADEEEPQEEVNDTDNWHILIVDDDKEIHTVTQLALSGVKILGKSLFFGHAYSGRDSVVYLREHSDVAIILMDVVMESDNAGLDAIKQIRDVLHQHDTRIILRTGQPGYAPEEQIVQDYDINDYKTKTELTRSKLVTTIISALRSYKQLCQIKQNHVYLQQIVEASSHIQKQPQPEKFVQLVVSQFSQLLQLPLQGLLLVQTLNQSENRTYVVGATDEFESLTQQSLEQIDNGRIIHQVSLCLTQEDYQLNEHDTVLFIPGQKHHAALYLDSGIQRLEQRPYIDVFLSNISVALDNIKLIQQLKTTAYTDKLSGLYNRAGFIKAVNHYLQNEQMGDVIALIDISHFSEVNHGLSQEIGNLMLKACTDRLAEQFSNHCQLARVNADVFGIIGSKETLNPESIESLFSFPLMVAEQRMPVYFNMGFLSRDDSTTTGLQALKRADIALNHAKKHNTQKYAYFDDTLEQKMAWRLGMVQQLRADFKAQKLQLWFQPQIDLQTTKVVGCEGLLRWPTENGNMISPDIFIPIAEHSGLIIEIGDWVIEQACREIKQLENLGITKIKISVNVSIAQFRDPTFSEKLVHTIESFNVNPELIELEITESILMNNPNAVINVLNQLKAHGIQIALDDFGTGFSSLSYLNKLPLSRMKINRSFVQDMDSGNGKTIVQTILSLGQKLKLKTIAEGVETETQAQYLTELGCDIIQGYLYSKPLPPEDFKLFIEQSLK